MSAARDRIRIGDRERAAAAERLSAHAAAGRLSFDELEQRLEAVQAAVVARDLDVLEVDLPSPAEPREPRPSRPALVLPIALLIAAVLTSALVGHPFPPLFIVAVLLWWRATRRRPWGEVRRADLRHVDKDSRRLRSHPVPR
jgi:uncharacterized protein DUF1707